MLTVSVAQASDSEEAARLSPRIRWLIGSVGIVGTRQVPERDLRPLLATQPRSWLTPWRSRPRFDREALADDAARLTAFYRERGYYRTRVRTTVVPDQTRSTVAVTIHVDEGPPVRVDTVDVVLTDATANTPILDEAAVVPLRPGDPFDERRYDEGRARLLGWARTAHFARATVAKRARVDVAAGTAAITYTLGFGPTSTFGPVTVEGLDRVARSIVLREVAFCPGAPFDPALLERTRRNLLRLRLFRAVTLVEDTAPDAEVPITIRVAEGPQHEIRAGAGYDTVEQVRGLLAWRDYDFLGGARQLGMTARASSIRRTIAADFVQPHWPTANARTRMLALFEDDQEDTYTLTQGRLAPRLEFTLAPGLLTYATYRIERDRLTDVSNAVSRALAPAATPHYATLSGFDLGLDWNGTDDLLNPTRGVVFTAGVEPVGAALGGDASFVRAQGTLRGYLPLPARLIVATRLRVGTIEPIAGDRAVPIWERFYAGGIDSVRGYARWRVGPLVRDQPLGGRSLTDMSFELQRAITDTIGVAAFIDAGQLSRKSLDPPLDDFQKGVGAGVQYGTPIGPLRVDLGFPLDRQGKDAAWQIYLSVGQAF